MKINIFSVLISGIIAGIVINISGIAMVPIFGNEMDTILESRALPPLSTGAMSYFGLMSLVLGVIMVWIYASVRPLFSSRMKAAITVSIVVWFLAFFWSNAALVAYGFMPMRLTIIGTAWGLVELLLAGVVGSWLYKDRN